MPVDSNIISVQDIAIKRRKPVSSLKLLERAKLKVVDRNIVPNTGNSLVQWIDLQLINKDTERFQNRKKEFSEDSVNRIIESVKNGSFEFAVFDPVLLWKDSNGNLYVLSGHSRTEAFKRLCKEGVSYKGYTFDRIPSKIIEVSESEAIQIALFSNSLSTRETDTERAYLYNKLFRLANTKEQVKEVLEKIKEFEGADANRITAYSFLNQNGVVIDALTALERGEIQSKAIVQSVASWIGKARKRFFFLTDAHEKEIYDFLIQFGGYGQATGQVNNEPDFMKLLQSKIDRITFDGNVDNTKPLNLRNLTQKSYEQQQYDKKLAELQKEYNETDKVLKEKRKFYGKKLENNEITLEQYRSVMQKYDDAVMLAQRDLIKHQNKYTQYIEAERAQTTLFGIKKIGKLTDQHRYFIAKDNRDLDKARLSMQDRKILNKIGLSIEKKYYPVDSDNQNYYQVPEKAVMYGLGAAEILRQNKYYTVKQNYKPTYKILSDYSHLFESKKLSNITINNDAQLNDTIDHLIKWISKNFKTLQNIAIHLKGDTPEQTCFNIWHFLRNNIAFQTEPEGYEQLKTLIRMLYDRKADCDDFAMASASILINLGYKPELWIVGFKNYTGYQHIYVVCKGIVLDAVMNRFNMHPDNIVRKRIIKL